MTPHLIIIAAPDPQFAPRRNSPHVSNDGRPLLLLKSQRVQILSAVRQLKRLGVRADQVITSDSASARYCGKLLRLRNVVRSKVITGNWTDVVEPALQLKKNIILVTDIQQVWEWVAKWNSSPIAIHPLTAVAFTRHEHSYILTGLWPAPAA